MTFTQPSPGQAFPISAAPAWPALSFTTDGHGPHSWQWTLTWRSFTRSGTATTQGNTWDASPVVTDCGGTLAVTATCGQDSCPITVRITGTNPVLADVVAHVRSLPGGTGFDRILQHESKSRHFGSSSEPLRSFDNGYGMCQLTTPEPTFEQVWNWKRNVEGGLSLFSKKRAAAKAYLSQAGRTFTESQLEYETVSRWNGGAYHAWDAAAGKWKRNPNVLCDRATGNIGWDINDPANAGKTEAELRKRDAASYSHAPTPGAHWRYYGVCYADRVLG